MASKTQRCWFDPLPIGSWVRRAWNLNQSVKPQKTSVAAAAASAASALKWQSPKKFRCETWGIEATCAAATAAAAAAWWTCQGQGNCRCWWGTKQNQFGKGASRKRIITWPITRQIGLPTSASKHVDGHANHHLLQRLLMQRTRPVRSELRLWQTSARSHSRAPGLTGPGLSPGHHLRQLRATRGLPKVAERSILR